MNSKRSAKKAAPTFAPAAWQWSPDSLRPIGKIQFWSAEGSCSLVSPEKARELVQARAAFVGSAIHICQVHDRIDGRNA